MSLTEMPKQESSVLFDRVSLKAAYQILSNLVSYEAREANASRGEQTDRSDRYNCSDEEFYTLLHGKAAKFAVNQEMQSRTDSNNI